jgi:glutamyl-tRNA synthetase
MAETKEFIKEAIFSPSFDLQKQYATYTGVLKNAVEGKVVTRFPPEPSGYLHIGHCKAALLNYHYAKMYKGNMILRFDDTNPSKEKNEYVEAIIEDLKTLGITHSILTYTSDYFPRIFDELKGLISKGLAYVDNTPVEKMREERTKKIDSLTRNFTVEQNLEIFDKLLAGEADDYCVRAKINMQSDNGCMRDPVLARASKVPHHRTGTKYRVYPTYDFACPIVDSLEGVTHVLRTNEYADRIPQYMWVLGALGWPKLEIYEYSRLNLEHTCLSKRKLTWFVDTNRVDGWDDPRFPTLRGVLRKGIRVETLVEFMLEQGPSKRANLMEWEKLWAINKRIIDPICPRFSAVSVDKACKLTIANVPQEPEAVTVEQNKLNKALGTRPLWRSNSVLIEFDDAENLLKVGEKVTLMNWGNVLILTKELQADGSYLLTGEYLPEDKDFKTTKKITWLAEGTNLIVANLIEFDHLIKTAKVEEDVNFEDIVNVNSKFVSRAYIDSGIRLLNEGNSSFI